MSERWRIEPEYAIRIDPTLGILGVLLEPASVIAKAIEQLEMIGRRSFWEPRTVLVTGAGPIGLLAALSVKQSGLTCTCFTRLLDSQAKIGHWAKCDVEDIECKIRQANQRIIALLTLLHVCLISCLI